MKKVFFLTAVVASLAGAALHFLHDALPNVLTALISPVNESVWEHLKLLYWPMLLSGFFLSRQAGKEARRRLEQLGEYGETASALTVEGLAEAGIIDRETAMKLSRCIIR